MIDSQERRRLRRRIEKAERRLARGIDVRVEKLRGEVSESTILQTLKEKLA